MNDPRLMWWIDRSAGLVSLVLLSAVMLLGVLATGRPGVAVRSRTQVQALHRQLSLTATILLGVHIVMAVTDSFVPLGWLDVVLPFRAGYRPVWIGLGALSFDVLVAVLVTSLLRNHLGQRAWRLVHGAAYLLWPLAVVHALGSGSDMRAGPVHLLGLICVGSVVAGACWRLVSGVAPAWQRMAALIALLAVTAAVASWASQGPLAPGWSVKALSSSGGGAR